METVLIIVAVVLILLVIAWLVATQSPKAKAKREERRLEVERGERAGRHREVATDRQLRADAAEQEAKRARADAELHETKAKMHDEGVADHELGRDPEPEGGERRRR